MNKIVRKRYPIEKLPEDLRGGLPPGVEVTVTVETIARPSLEELHASALDFLKHPKPMTYKEIRTLAGPRNTTPSEAIARIRALRDEWDG